MKLETKLGWNTSVLVFAMLLSASVAHLKIHQANQISDAMMASRLPAIASARDLRMQLGQCVLSAESVLLARQVSLQDAFAAQRDLESHWVQAGRAMQQLRDEAGNAGLNTAQLDEIARGMNSLRSALDAATSSSEHGASNAHAGEQAMLHDVLPQNADMYAAVSAVITAQEKASERDLHSLDSGNRAALISLWGATLVGACIGYLVAFLLGRRIARTFDIVAERADAIAAGELTGAELSPGTTVQLGRMALAVNRLQASLREITGSLSQTSGSLATRANAMRSSSDGMHQRIDQQSQQTQQAATAMAEMSASIAEVSRHAHDAAQTARDAAQTAHEGGEIVTSVHELVQEMAANVEATSEGVCLLGEDSKRISQIVTVIDEIAKKTNLLALNAAIEAARAGEQGRSFSVVAGEVRRLAESTAHATGEIGEMIQGIQHRTQTLVVAMKDRTDRVYAGLRTTTQAGEALKGIIGMAERVDRMIAQIAIASSQQAAAADQSSASLDAIHGLSSDNLKDMTATADNIEALRSSAILMEQQVERFSGGRASTRREPAYPAAPAAWTPASVPAGA